MSVAVPGRSTSLSVRATARPLPTRFYAPDFMMVDQFDHVTHVAPDTICERLVELGAQSVVGVPDRLTHGPVATDPQRHREGRLAYWRKLYDAILAQASPDQLQEAMDRLSGGYVSSEQVGSAAYHAAEGGRIVIWTTPTLEGRLFLWFVFYGLLQRDVPPEDIATAEPRAPLESTDGGDRRYEALVNLDLGGLKAGFDDLFYPELVYLEAGANLWETFASSSPRQFALAIPHTTKFFPQFPVFAEDYGKLFPTVEPEYADAVGVSRLDARLLERLDDTRLQTGGEILGAELVDEFGFLGTSTLLARLRAWSRVGPDDGYVEARADASTADVLTQFSYTITSRGRAVLERGFEPGSDLPLFQVGDSRLYVGQQPWVKVVDGDHWWFERFEATE